MAQEDYFARVVTLRQDADQSIIGDDQQGANTMLGHLLNRFIDRLIGRYRLDSVLVFALQHPFNCVGVFHSAPKSLAITCRCANPTPGCPCRHRVEACPYPSRALEQESCPTLAA